MSDIPDKNVIQSVVEQARQQFAKGGAEFELLGMTKLKKATIGDWLVCRAEQQRSCARLLDVAVALETNASVLAILAPPPGAKQMKPDDRSREYLRQYQTCAWHGCGVAFVLDDGVSSFDPYEELAAPDGLEDLATAIEQQLMRDVHDKSPEAFWITAEGSRELEGLVRISVDRALRDKGFKRHADDETALPNTYRGFWRRAEADGVWSRKEGEPRHLALEVKMTEDVVAPLSQVVDHFAHAKAVVLVRGSRPEKRKKKKKKTLTTPTMQRLSEAAVRLSARAPVRYIDLELPR